MNHKLCRIMGLILGLGLATAAVLTLSQALAVQAAGPWYVSPSGNDGDCLSWATACTTIDGALGKASPGDTINVAAGVYVENVFIDKDIVLQGAGADSTFIDGGGVDATVEVYRYLNVSISGMTIRNGNRSGSGGGILISRDCTVQVTDATIFDNEATSYGGGIYMDFLSVVTLTNSTVISNSAGRDGGGIYSTDSNGTLTIIDSTVSGNVAEGAGGGVYQRAGTLTIDGSSIISNTSQSQGGGIGKSSGVMTVRKSVIADNMAVRWGGGLYTSASVVTLEDSTVRGNRLSSTDSRGGGIFCSSRATLNNVTVAGNTSIDDGGGIHSQDAMTLTNVTVSGNASEDGGGIFHTNKAYTMSLFNCTVVSNTVSAGGVGPGGIRLYSSVIAWNTVLAHNENANCLMGSSGSLTSRGYNLEDTDSCGLNATGDITDTNPLLGPLQNNGGTSVGLGEATLTHGLLSDSPAIDAGDPAFTPPPEYDQRGPGFPRVVGGRIDIGAYEINPLKYIYLPLVIKD